MLSLMRTQLPRSTCTLFRRTAGRFGWIFLIAVFCALPAACTVEEDAPSAQPETTEPALQGRKSTLGKAVDAAERTRDRAAEYNEAVEREADDLHK